MVKKGDFLAQIDPRPYQAALEQAQGQLPRDQALLQGRAGRPRALPEAGGAGFDRAAAGATTRSPGPAGRGHGQVRPGAGRQRQAQPHLLPHRRAGRPAASACARSIPATTCRPSDANGLVVITQLQPITVIFTLPEDNLPAVHEAAATPARRCRSPPSTAAATTKLADRQADHARQPDRHHHRHGQAARAVRQHRRNACSPTSSSMRSCWSTRCSDATVIPTAAVQRGAPGTYRLSGQARQHGDGAAGQARARRDGERVAVTIRPQARRQGGDRRRRQAARRRQGRAAAPAAGRRRRPQRAHGRRPSRTAASRQRTQ